MTIDFACDEMLDFKRRPHRCSDGFCGAGDCERCHPGASRHEAICEEIDALYDTWQREVKPVNGEWLWEITDEKGDSRDGDWCQTEADAKAECDRAWHRAVKLEAEARVDRQSGIY